VDVRGGRVARQIREAQAGGDRILGCVQQSGSDPVAVLELGGACCEPVSVPTNFFGGRSGSVPDFTAGKLLL